MAEYDVMRDLQESKAILKGHFVLSSGLHSDTYLQCAKLFEKPGTGLRVGAALADSVRSALKGRKVDAVVAPAIGGIILGYEVARGLDVPFAFLERVNGRLHFRRGLSVEPGQKILIAEDVVTTGGTVLEVAEVVKDLGCEPIMCCAVVCRNESLKMPFDFVSLARLDIKSYSPDELPARLRDIPPVMPGSKFVKQSME